MLAHRCRKLVDDAQACYLMARLYCLLANPVYNLAVCVFQRYYHELCQALSTSPEEVAEVLYRNEMLSVEERSQVVDVQTQIPLNKGLVLLQAVERRIITEKSAAPLRKFCRVLQRHHDVGSILSRMKFRLGEQIGQLSLIHIFIPLFPSFSIRLRGAASSAPL